MTKKENNNNNALTDVRPIVSSENATKVEQFLSMPMNFFKTKPVVAVLRLEGIIGKVGSLKSGLTLNSLNKKIEKAFSIDKLKALYLVINSPGGSPVQSELIASRITNLAKQKNIPVYSFVEDVAASGGYWLACAGEKIYASKSSILGSIGVISSSFGFQDAIKKLGIERRIYTQGDTKSVLDPFKPAQDSDIKIIKNIQKEIHAHFIDAVRASRNSRLTQTDNIIFNGEFWTGQKALDYGLIDGIHDLYSFIHDQYGDNVKIKHIEHKQSWIKRTFSASQISEDFSKNLVDAALVAMQEKSLSSKFDM